MSFSPVKELALSRGTPVFQPALLRDGVAAKTITGLCCDLIVVVAYGKILPKEILDIPPLGCINIHGSILPKYRGAAPIQHAILNGERVTGVTSQYISEGMDEGDILFVKKTDIGDDETSADLFERLSVLGAELLSETVSAISEGSVKGTAQNDDEATYAPLLTKTMSPIDWNDSAVSIKCKVRALFLWPAATMRLDGKTLKVLAVDVSNDASGKAPGSIISYGGQGIEVACADGSVIVKLLQSAGGKIMPASDYIRGNPIKGSMCE